jgi:hypothetical protein
MATGVCNGRPNTHASRYATRPPVPQVFVSYLEIYNEVGYDLLDPAREVAQLEDMPQVRTRGPGWVRLDGAVGGGVGWGGVGTSTCLPPCSTLSCG